MYFDARSPLPQSESNPRIASYVARGGNYPTVIREPEWIPRLNALAIEGWHVASVVWRNEEGYVVRYLLEREIEP
jgi:hypothetical protein